jgi:hypothetical protein
VAFPPNRKQRAPLGHAARHSGRYWFIYVFLDGDEYLASDALLGVKDEFVAQVLDRLSQSAPRFFYRYSLIAAILSVPPPTA